MLRAARAKAASPAAFDVAIAALDGPARMRASRAVAVVPAKPKSVAAASKMLVGDAASRKVALRWLLHAVAHDVKDVRAAHALVGERLGDPHVEVRRLASALVVHPLEAGVVEPLRGAVVLVLLRACTRDRDAEVRGNVARALAIVAPVRPEPDQRRRTGRISACCRQPASSSHFA